MFHMLAIAPQAEPSALTVALVDAGIVFGFTLFSALVTLSAASVRADPFIALYGPLMGAGLAFFYSLKSELAKRAVTQMAAQLAAKVNPPGASP